MGRIRRHPIVSTIVAVILLLFIIAGVAGSKKKTAPSSTTETTATAKAPTSSGPNKNARAYITKLGADAARAQATIQVVQIDVTEAQKSASSTGLNRVAIDAQRAHDTLDGIRQNFADTTTESGKIGDAETEVFVAANDLKNAMGALVAYTGAPNPATLAHFTTQYQRAVGEWNDGIATIWRAARRKDAPTI